MPAQRELFKEKKYFTLREALYLPTWHREADEKDGLNDEVLRNLNGIFSTLDEIRGIFGSSITIHCAYRPPAYNKEIGGAPKSAHIEGKAVDFSVKGYDCNHVREVLHPILDAMKIRMEDLPDSPWVHIDSRQSAPRYFKP